MTEGCEERDPLANRSIPGILQLRPGGLTLLLLPPRGLTQGWLHPPYSMRKIQFEGCFVYDCDAFLQWRSPFRHAPILCWLKVLYARLSLQLIKANVKEVVQ
jgi:hypothetical protein